MCNLVPTKNLGPGWLCTQTLKVTPCSDSAMITSSPASPPAHSGGAQDVSPHDTKVNKEATAHVQSFFNYRFLPIARLLLTSARHLVSPLKVICFVRRPLLFAQPMPKVSFV